MKLSANEIEMRVENLWKGYFNSERDDQFVAVLDRILVNIERFERRSQLNSSKIFQQRAEVIIGPAGSGKSTMVNYQLGLHTGFPGFAQGPYPNPNSCEWAVSVSVQAPCTISYFGVQLLHAMGFPYNSGKPDAATIMRLVGRHLREHQVKLIIVDEVHSLTETQNALELKKLQNLFRSLLNDPVNPVQLLLVGTEAALIGLNDTEGQLGRRANVMRIQSMQIDKTATCEKIIRKLAKIAEADITDGQPHQLAAKLIHATWGRLGIAVEMTIEAIEEALRDGSGLSCEHFARIYARRKAVPASLNPFIREDFSNIEIKNFETQNEDDEVLPPKRRNRS